MLKGVLWAAALSLVLSSVADARPVRVKGYFRKDGTYVQPHVRSSPNRTTLDNYGDTFSTPRPRAAAPYYPVAPLYTPTPIAPYVPPTAAPKVGRSIAIFGKGPTINCGDWAGSPDSTRHAEGLGWLLGFYSAASLYAADSDDFTQGSGADGLYGVTMDFCHKNPTITLNYAADAITKAFAVQDVKAP